MTNLDDSKIDLLLLVLHTHTGLDSLLRRGLEYHQIIQFIEQAKESGFVQSDQNGTQLTASGIDRINASRMNSSRAVPDSWIAPDIKSTNDRVDPSKIYLPPKSWRAG